MMSQKVVGLPRYEVVGRAVGVAIFVVLTALAARVTIPLPFTPVPVTLQVFTVLLSGLVLGPTAGACSQLIYLGLIAAGYPLDAYGLGPLALFGPSGGYLLAFAPASFVSGYLASKVRGEGRVLRFAARFLASLAGVAVIYAVGALWLDVNMGLGVDLQAAFLMGIAPFILADVGKAAAAALLSDGARRLLG